MPKAPHSLDALRAVSINDAADALGIGRRTLYRLINAGEFPQPLKIGRSSRILVRDIESFIRRKSVRREFS